MWVINPAVGSHYFPPVTPATLKRAAINFAAWWTEAQWMWTVCLRLLPDSVATAIWTRALLRVSPARSPLGYRATLVKSTMTETVRRLVQASCLPVLSVVSARSVNISTCLIDWLIDCSAVSSPICRICHETAAREVLLSPCKCRGTVGLVHRTCIERWLATANVDSCEICRHRYRTERRNRPFREVCWSALQNAF